MNLDSLRRKRVKRKGVKATATNGQRHVFFILDRATKKFHGDVGLWMQYIEYARKQRANKKLTRVLTDALRMHPTRPELWIYAARYAMDAQADIGAARSYMQRGLRFCRNSKQIYLEYARLEMSYIAKIFARRNILGLGAADVPAEEVTVTPDDDDDNNADTITLPSLTAGEAQAFESGRVSLNETAPQALSSTPAMNGAIPVAIFQAAMKQFNHDLALAETFFDMFADFIYVPATSGILQDILTTMSAWMPLSSFTISCRCRLHILGVAADSPAYPAAVGAMIKDLRSALRIADPTLRSKMSAQVLTWLSPLAHDTSTGPELSELLSVTETQLARQTSTLGVPT